MAATLPLACLATAKTPQFNLFSPLSSSSLSSSPSLSVSLLSLHSKKWGVLSKRFCGKSKWRAAVAEETLVPEDSPAESPVAVPVLPSDMLTMFFKAEGTMDESAISAITKSLEGIEGISELKVETIEGIASVELTKQTTVQATGVASNLVEVIQGSGFKLQTLNLSFEDEEDSVA